MQDRVFGQSSEISGNEFFKEIGWAALLDRVRRESPGFDA
jgi:hypothetical protein